MKCNSRNLDWNHPLHNFHLRAEYSWGKNLEDGVQLFMTTDFYLLTDVLIESTGN